jgi:hypothetical protein
VGDYDLTVSSPAPVAAAHCRVLLPSMRWQVVGTAVVAGGVVTPVRVLQRMRLGF